MSITCVTTTLAPCVPAGNTTRLFVPVPYCRLMMYCSLHLYIRVNSLKLLLLRLRLSGKLVWFVDCEKEELCRGTFTVLRVNRGTAYPFFAMIKRAKAWTLCKDQACKGVDIVQGSSVQCCTCARINRATAYSCTVNSAMAYCLCSGRSCNEVHLVQTSSAQWRTRCASIIGAVAYSIVEGQLCSDTHRSYSESGLKMYLEFTIWTMLHSEETV